MMVTLPTTHLDLFQTAAHGVLTTMMPDDTLQSSIIWVDYDGEYVLINTTLERQKGKNMRANPKVAILVIDPKDSSRWIEVRGQVKEITQVGAGDHADKLHSTLLSKQTLFLW
jgi:PPOX class probable F420-dependent enzyme